MAAYRRRVVYLLLPLISFLCISFGDSVFGQKRLEVDNEGLNRVKRDAFDNFPAADNPKRNRLPGGGRKFNPEGNNDMNNKYHLRRDVAPSFDQDRLPETGGNNGALPKAMGAGGNNRHDGNLVFKPKVKQLKIKISTSTECAADVQKFCSKGVKDNNFSILDCLQSDERTNDDVSPECQHYLWQYKLNLTRDDRFDRASDEVCNEELKEIKECRELPRGQGQVIPCLIDNEDKITTRTCKEFLNKMGNIIFSDYRLIYRFAQECQDDILKYKCGRVGTLENADDSPHSQGQTVDCLSQHTEELRPFCRKQVLRVFELQSDDFHLDRPLFYACQDDRDALCDEVKAGNGAVFQCLFDHLGTRKLTEKCREKLEIRQRLAAQDVKIDHLFYTKCRDDIEKHNCIGGTVGEEDAKRATVLLCLEGAHMDERSVDAGCVQEMIKVRQRLIDDYQINPDLIARCSDEISNHCEKLEPGGDTLHCLMKLARKSHRKKGHKGIRPECQAQLSYLLREANIAEDIRIDKPLQNACSDVVTALCSHVRPGGGAIIGCLMDNIDEDEMTAECEDRLLEIQFFMARDFRLDPDLYQSCSKDAAKHCHESGNWADNSMSPDQGPRVLSCLHGHIRHSGNDHVPQLSRACIMAVHRVMEQRALSVDLHPTIEDACMQELGEMCSDDKADVKKGAEIDCLQMNYDTLTDSCKNAIRDFTVQESEDIHMDTILMKACTPMIKKFCDDELDNDAEADEVLDCLIEHKNHADMQPKCAVGIEHHQLISLKEFRFNHKFKEACHKSTQKLCKGKISKYEVVSCLSEHVRNDTLLDRSQRVEQPCRKQLRAELLQRGESIKLDPELQRACKNDVEDYCKNVSPGNAAVLECLKKNKPHLSKPCHKLLFVREKEEFAVADYALVRTCKKMIREHCETASTEPEIFNCLKKYKDDDSFDDKCRRIVLQRQITQSKDYRLNPILQKECHQDIPKFCSDVVVKEENDQMLEGKVINCLKKQFAIKRLSASCERQVRERVKAAALDIRQAPVLFKSCKADIATHCSHHLLTELGDIASLKALESGPGKVVECLKAKFASRQISGEECRQELAMLVAESHIDVNVDPLLQAACQKDLHSLCRNVDAGQGRQMSCLLSFLDVDPKAMTTNCRELLDNRKKMWELAAQVAPPETFGEIYDSIVTSPSKNYFLAVVFTVIGIIFIVGLSCGRVTKRVRAEMKNK